MPRMAQFILALLLGLSLLAWAASSVVQTTAREWFERDVSSRAQLVLVGAGQSLAHAWYGDPKELQKQLVDLARDERVMGAAVCDTDLKERSSTPGFPAEFSCWAVGSRVREAGPDGIAGRLQEWSTVATLPTGRVHVSVMPITDQGHELGFAILLHDLSYIERREAKARTFLLMAFGILAVMAFGVPLFVAKRARYGWSLELRRLLRGGAQQSREFQPILSDVRELVGRMANDREDAPGLWTAERLKQTLNRYLHGEKVVILANREPYIHQHTADGGIEVQHPASGLVDGAGAGNARLLRGMGGPRQRRRRSRNGGRKRSRPRTARRRVVSHPACLALRGRAEGLLLRLLERRVVAPLSRGARAAGIPRRGLAAVPGRQSEVRRCGVQRSGLERPDHPGAGLSLRAGARDDSEAPALGHRPRVLAHSMAQRGAHGNLSLAQRTAAGYAGQQHSWVSHATPLQQFHRFRGPVPGDTHRPGAKRGGDAGPPHINPSVSHRPRMACPMGRDDGKSRGMPGAGVAGFGTKARRAR